MPFDLDKAIDECCTQLTLDHLLDRATHDVDPRVDRSQTEMSRKWNLSLAIAASLASLTIMACKSSEDRGRPDESSDADDDSDDDMFGPMAKMLAEGLDKPGPYEETRHSDDYAEGVAHWAVVELDEPIGEVESMSLLDPQMVEPLREMPGRIRSEPRRRPPVRHADRRGSAWARHRRRGPTGGTARRRVPHRRGCRGSVALPSSSV